MNRLITTALLSLLLCSTMANASPIRESTDSYGPFGKLHIYQGSEHPAHMVLFISGDGGWNLGVVDMARALAGQDSMVVGIDITHYIHRLNTAHGKCTYAAAHFEALSQYLQKKHGFTRYQPPVLVGYSSGATMVYATLAQSPANTFAGGISLGFCPDLKTSKPFCRGNGNMGYSIDRKLGFIYKTVSALPSPWAVLQGQIDQVCNPPKTGIFVNRVGNGELISLPRVGHGFSVQRNWMPQFKGAFERIVRSEQRQAAPRIADAAVKDLPLVVLPVEHPGDSMAVIVSGDGGWANIDKQIGEALHRQDIPVVGLDSLQYFWRRKTPDIAGADLTRILQHFSHAWGSRRFILVGYSRGADTLPFMASRLPGELKSRVSAVALLGLEPTVDFEFHVQDWLSTSGDGQYKVVPEVARLAGMNVSCIEGADEEDSACKQLDAGHVHIIGMQGGHHFGGDYETLAGIILRQSRAGTQAAR